MKRLAYVIPLLMACSAEPTQVVVEVHADDDVRGSATFMRLQVESEQPGGQFVTVFDSVQPVRPEQWPRRHVLAPENEDSSRTYRVTARGQDEAFAIVSETRVRSGFLDGESRVLHVRLLGGECLGVSCPTDLTCQAGACVEAPVIPPASLPPLGSPPPSSDAGTPDVVPDAPPACVPGAPCVVDGELGACEQAITRCDEGVSVCVRDNLGSETTCRPAEGACDVAEVCSGVSPECPADASADLGTECGDDMFCIDGVCSDCIAGGECPGTNDCEVGTINCDTGAPVCTGSVPALAGTECRPSAGPCDLAELCDGTSLSCPSDQLADAIVCRGPAGMCDVAESCDGSSAACPDDAFVAIGTTCREAGGLCDGEETCMGGAMCPEESGSFPEGTVCRPPVSGCDVAETCDAVGVCPTDGFVPFGAPCAGGMSCDGAGNCGDFGCGDPCTPEGEECSFGEVVCAGGMTICERRGFLTSVCRAAAGACDLEESCDGASPSCPPDVLSTSECRPAGGDCDLAEVCDGSSVACPSDLKRPSDFVCRPERDGGCDLAETCTGVSNACPGDAVVGANAVCRPAMGLCDAQEVCDGVSPSCPPDGVRASGNICRPLAGGCDIADVCNGVTKICPDTVQASGVMCGGAPTEPVCDPPDSCDGSSPTCEPVFAPPMTRCGPTSGSACMAMECDGSGACVGIPVLAGTPCGPGAVCDSSGACEFGLVISEVQPGDGGFIELYNRLPHPVTTDHALAACNLIITPLAGPISSHSIAGFTIPAHGFFLGRHESSGGDTMIPAPAPRYGGGSYILRCGIAGVDGLAWGSASPVEGTRAPAPPLPAGSLERKACVGSNSLLMLGAHRLWGNSFDTNDNATNFVRQNISTPQMLSSIAEVPMCP